MRAAVVTSFPDPPRYREHPDPVAAGDVESVVDVVAAALHPVVRGIAAGRHYSGTRSLPLIPGIDAVVRDAEGRLHYALLGPTSLGTMAERTVVERDRTVPLPAGVDPVAVAAAMNPVMSSWVALRRRIDLPEHARVLVLGATGNAGSMALQVARLLGAAEVVAAARDRAKLSALGDRADRVLGLDELGDAGDVDVVLDYLWGEPAVAGIQAVLRVRSDRRAPLSWIEIGSVAGPDAAIPAAALRAARLQLVGSGIGSVSGAEFVDELPAIARAITDGAFEVRARAVPLRDVESVWDADSDGERIVFVP
jgi:NADPH:quinone reductase-like Zn-dependent oxidoreductase